MIFITSYSRPNLLLRLLKELEGEDVVVFDDGSDYDCSDHLGYVIEYYRNQHYGKRWFYKLWNFMLSIAKEYGADEFIFLQDDLYDIDLEGLRNIELPDKYAFNLMDVGIERGWTPEGYVDCNFMTNRSSLESIGWTIEPVPADRWDNDTNLSSGVGQHLSKAFWKSGVPMYLPERNYASHGDNESFMHGELRKCEPLIAITGKWNH